MHTQSLLEGLHISAFWAALAPDLVVGAVVVETLAGRAARLAAVTLELSLPAYHTCYPLQGGRAAACVVALGGDGVIDASASLLRRLSGCGHINRVEGRVGVGVGGGVRRGHCRDSADYLWRAAFDCCGGVYPGECLRAGFGLYCTGDPRTVHLRMREYEQRRCVSAICSPARVCGSWVVNPVKKPQRSSEVIGSESDVRLPHGWSHSGFESVVERVTSGRERNQRSSLTMVMSLGGWRAGRRAA